MSMSIPYFFEPVTLVRDRLMIIDAGGTEGLVSGQPADRKDVLEANEAADHFDRQTLTACPLEHVVAGRGDVFARIDQGAVEVEQDGAREA